MSEIERLSSTNKVSIATGSLGNVVDIVHPELVKLVVNSDLSEFVYLVGTLDDCNVFIHMG